MVFRLVSDKDPFLKDDAPRDPKALRRLDKGDCDWGAIASLSKAGRGFVFRCLRPHPQRRWAAEMALKYCAGRRRIRREYSSPTHAIDAQASASGGPRRQLPLKRRLAKARAWRPSSSPA